MADKLKIGDSFLKAAQRVQRTAAQSELVILLWIVFDRTIEHCDRFFVLAEILSQNPALAVKGMMTFGIELSGFFKLRQCFLIFALTAKHFAAI